MDTTSGLFFKNGRIESFSIGINTAEVLFRNSSGRHICLVFHGATSVYECKASYEKFAEFKTEPTDGNLKKHSFLSASSATLLEIIAEDCAVCNCGEAQNTSPLLFDMLPELLGE